MPRGEYVCVLILFFFYKIFNTFLFGQFDQ